jgi:hypothetical protein
VLELSQEENQIWIYKFLDGLKLEFDQIRQQLTQKESNVTLMEAFMVVVHEKIYTKVDNTNNS